MNLQPVFKDVKNFSCEDLYLYSVGAPSGKDIWVTCHGIAKMLIDKNIAYGDSALRLMKGTDYVGDNDIDDLIGYLVLLKIAKEKNVN